MIDPITNRDMTASFPVMSGMMQLPNQLPLFQGPMSGNPGGGVLGNGGVPGIGGGMSLRRIIGHKEAVDTGHRIGANQVSRVKMQSPGVERFVSQNIDIARLSEECAAELKRSGVDKEGGNVDALVENLMGMRIQDALGKAKKIDASKMNKGPKEKAEISWTPLIAAGQQVKRGQSWGQFNITRTKNLEAENAEAQMADKNAIVENMTASEAGNKQGGKGIKDSRKDTKLQQAAAGKGGGQKGQGGAMGLSSDESGDYFINDTGTGERHKVPENGDIKASRDMDITFVGNGGKLGQGGTLFAYRIPSGKNEDREKKLEESGTKSPRQNKPPELPKN